jgi:hypothetical protein
MIKGGGGTVSRRDELTAEYVNHQQLAAWIRKGFYFVRKDYKMT